MLLRWGLIYLQFVLVVVLGCLLYFQHLRTAAGIADVESLNAKLAAQHKLLTDAEKKFDVASREARSAADMLAEERRARAEAEKAVAEAQHEIVELRKYKSTAEESARQAAAELARERRAKKRQATIAKRRYIARALRAARVQEAPLTRATAPDAAEIPEPTKVDDGTPLPAPAAPARLPQAAKKAAPTFNPLAPAQPPATTSSTTPANPAKKGTAAGTPKPKAKKPSPSVWDGLF